MAPPDDLLDVLLERLAVKLAPHVAALMSAPQTPEWATAKSNPLGSARAFLDAGRRGDFVTFKRCREVVAKWADVDAYIASRKTRRAPPHVPQKPSAEPDYLAKFQADRAARAAAKRAA